MNNADNFIANILSSLDEKELLQFYDNPRNFKIRDCRSEYWENENKDFPKHCFLSLTHGTYAVNEKIRRIICKSKDNILRLLKNFSDFGTRKMTKKMGIPQEQIIISKKSRLIGDENREIQKKESDDNLPIGQKFIRPYDFNGKTIINDLEPYRDEGIEKCGKHHARIEESHEKGNNIIGGSIQFDIHDTDVNMMDYDSKNDSFRKNKETGQLEGFPFMNIGTLDGDSCDQEIVEYLCKRITKYLGITPLMNKPYKGGYVTNKHGKESRKKGNNNRNVIQIEIARYLYMKTSTQEVDWERMEIIGEGLKRAIADTGIMFGEEYFNNLK